MDRLLKSKESEQEGCLRWQEFCRVPTLRFLPQGVLQVCQLYYMQSVGLILILLKCLWTLTRLLGCVYNNSWLIQK